MATSDYASGLNQLEATVNAALVLVTLVVWGLFLAGLWSKDGGRRRFYAVLFLHLAPLPLAFFDSNEREFWQFLRYAALGGVALIIGLPHHGWEPGARRRPRILTAVAVVLAFLLMAASSRLLFPGPTHV